MADDVIMRLDADGTGTVEVIDQIDASLQVLSDSIASVAESAGNFTALDDAMAELSSMTAQSADDAAAASDAMAGFANAVDTASMSASEYIAYIAGADEALNTFAQSVDVAATQTMLLDESLTTLTADEAEAEASTSMFATIMTSLGEAASWLGEQLSGMMGPMMMIVTVAALVGGGLMSMGMSGQKGEALLRGMAGASQQDINALQTDALQLGETMDQASSGFYQVESAGYAGAGAIKVFDAASRLAIGGQSSQKDTMSALTAIMHDYNASADEATHYTDLMAEAVLRGKQSSQDFSSAIGPLASAGENVGLSFEQVAAAEATMTQINPHVAQDAQQLTSLFNFLSPTMGGVSKAAKGLGLAFNEQKYNSEDLLGKLQYLADIAGGTNTAAFVKLTGGVRGSTAAIDLLKNGASSFKDNLNAMGNSAGATEQAFQQFENTVPAHLDKVGASLSMFATKFMDAIGPKVVPVIDKFTSAISTAGDWILQHTDLLVPALSALAAVIGTVLVSAVVSFVVASWPIILILTAIAAVVGGVVYAFTHWSQVMGVVNNALKIPAIAAIADALHGVWNFLVSSFTPVWQDLVNVWNSQILPSVHQLVDTFNQVKPELTILAEFIGVILVIDIGLVVGAIGGFIKGLAGMLSGIAEAIGGIVQIITGVVQVVSGIVAFIVDLFTGHFDKLSGDLKVIFGGIVNIFSGFGNVVKGIFDGIVKGVSGEVSGFADGVVGYFNNIVHGVDNKTKEAADKAQIHTLEMKDNTIKHAIETDTNTVEKFDHMRQGIIEQLSQTKDEAERKSLEIKLTQVTHAEQTAIQVRDKHVKMRQDTENELDKLKKSASDSFGSMSKDIQNIVGNVTKWIQDQWHNATKFVVDKFEWLYNHNYYFKDLVDSITNAVDTCRKWLEDTWNNVAKFAVDKWNDLVKGAQQLWQNISKPFQDAWGTYIGPALNNLWNSISSTVSGWVKSATDWGKNLINSFADGIKSALGAVGDAVGAVGDKIKSILGFHSPTEYLPDADQWAPNFMDMFIAGIEGSEGRLKQVVGDTGKILSQGLNAQLQASIQPQINTALTLPPTSTLPTTANTQNNNNQAIQLLSNIAQSLQQLVQQSRNGNTTGSTNVAFNAVSGGTMSQQQIYQFIQSLSGYSFEANQRGAY